MMGRETSGTTYKAGPEPTLGNRFRTFSGFFKHDASGPVNLLLATLLDAPKHNTARHFRAIEASRVHSRLA